MRKIERLWKVKDGSSERGRGDRGVQRGEREAAGVSGHVFPESPSAKWITTRHLKSSLRRDLTGSGLEEGAPRCSRSSTNPASAGEALFVHLS